MGSRGEDAVLICRAAYEVKKGKALFDALPQAAIRCSAPSLLYRDSRRSS
jgi:hypothetical protein